MADEIQVTGREVSIIGGGGGLNANFIGSADVDGVQITVYKGGNVQFTDLTPGTNTNWSWSLPGTVALQSFLQSPSINYPTIGVYDVILQVGDLITGAGGIKKRTGYINVSLPPTDPDTQLFLDRLSVQPTVDMGQAINNFIANFKLAHGIDNLTDILDFIHCPKLSTQVDSNLNWVKSAHTLVPDTSSWVQYRGYILDTLGFLKSGFTPSTAVRYSRLNASMAVYNGDDEYNKSGYLFGVQSGADYTLLGLSSGTDVVTGGINNSGAQQSGTNRNSLGLFSIDRTALNTLTVKKDGVTEISVTKLSSALPTLETYYFAANSNGTEDAKIPGVFEFAIGGKDIDWSLTAPLVVTLLEEIIEAQITAGNSSYNDVNFIAPTNMNMALSMTDLSDLSGNGNSAVLGASLPMDFTAPIAGPKGGILFNGQQTIKLNTGLTFSLVTVSTVFASFYTDTPETMQNVFTYGTQYDLGLRIAAYDKIGNHWVRAGGVFADEGVAGEPIYGHSQPKMQAGYNVVGFSFVGGASTARMYHNGVMTYFTNGLTGGVSSTAGWLGGFPGGTVANAYYLPANYELLDVVYTWDASLSVANMQQIGDNITRALNLHRIFFVGDSITQGFTVPTNGENWPSLVTEYLLANTSYKWAATNIGMGGRTLNQMADICFADASSVKYESPAGSPLVTMDRPRRSMAPRQKEVAVLLAGINDLANNATAAAMETQLGIWVASMNKQGFMPFVLTPTSDASLTAPQEAQRLLYNTYLRANESLGYTCVDICSNSNLAGQPSGPDAYFSDGVHWTALTCGIVADMVNAAIIAVV